MQDGSLLETIKVIFAYCGAVIVSFLGGDDQMLALFGILVAFDLLLGALSGIKTRTFTAHLFRWEVVNKILEVIVVIIFNIFDDVTQVDLFRNSALIWFILCEASRSFDNLVVLGVSLPMGLHKAVSKLKHGFQAGFIVEVIDKMVSDRAKKDERN